MTGRGLIGRRRYGRELPESRQMREKSTPHFKAALRCMRARLSPCARRRILTPILCVLLSAAMVHGAGAAKSNSTNSGSTTLEGRLSSAPGRVSVLRTSNKDYRLTATASYVLHTLQDKRLNGREIRAEGTVKPDGSFTVQKFFTVHNGKLYRVRYYCETCNIVAFEPGRCVCCQQPTELQEVPIESADQDTITVP